MEQSAFGQTDIKAVHWAMSVLTARDVDVRGEL